MGNKTLAQLSQEGKDVKYITLDLGSKLSGYTKEYLERLCRLNKIAYGLWHNGQYVVELESLLKETQTILISYEGLTFVDKKDIEMPLPPAPELPPPPVIAPPPDLPLKPNVFIEQTPSFTENSELRLSSSNSGRFSFIGRAVVSNSRTGDVRQEEKTAIPIVVSGTSPNVPVPAVSLPENSGLTPPPPKVQIPITVSHDVSADTLVSSGQHKEREDGAELRVSAAASAQKSTARVSIPVLPAGADEWDARLLGKAELPAPENITPVPPPQNYAPSPYRPIDTSKDTGPTHEDVPLFPPLIVKDKILPFAVYPAQFSKAASSIEPTIEAAAVTPFIPVSQGRTMIPSSQAEEVHHDAPLASPPTPLAPVTPIAPVIPTLLASPEAPKPTPLASPSVPVLPSSIISSPLLPKQVSLPMAVQSKLPAILPEHHLVPAIDTHPLVRNIGFNAAFVLLFLASSFFAVGALPVNGKLTRIPAGANVAGVGAISAPSKSLSSESVSLPPDVSTAGSALPFSDEVTVTREGDSRLILVRPIFKSGAGNEYEYEVAPASPLP